MIKRNVSSQKKKIIAASGEWKCGMCRELLPSHFEIDHIRPLWKNGTNDQSNLWALCSNCHAKKTEQETIERNENTIQKFLYCNKCDRKVSPYFLHKC